MEAETPEPGFNGLLRGGVRDCFLIDYSLKSRPSGFIDLNASIFLKEDACLAGPTRFLKT